MLQESDLFKLRIQQKPPCLPQHAGGPNIELRRYTGVIILPTPTTHHCNKNPSNCHTCALFDPPKMVSLKDCNHSLKIVDLKLDHLSKGRDKPSEKPPVAAASKRKTGSYLGLCPCQGCHRHHQDTCYIHEVWGSQKL